MSTSTTGTNGSTTIIIPGRETQTIPGVILTKADVIASFAGDINLSSMESSETKNGDSVTITFSNRTGTKGNDIYVAGDLVLNGDVTINSTRIEIPGREAQVIPGVMSKNDILAAFSGTVDLGSMECNDSVSGDTQVFTFSNRTGTKGNVDSFKAIMDLIQAAAAQASAPAVEEEEEDEFEEEGFEEDEDDFVELKNTKITIPGRETIVLKDLVMDATMVKNSFSGQIDLSGYNVEEIEQGDTLEVRFTARTGTKGKA
jgi:hypothetical protein